MTVTVKYTIEESEIGVGMKQNVTLQNMTGIEQVLCGRLLRVINKLSEEIEAENEAIVEDLLD